MKIIFTFDDGLKSHLSFYDKTGIKGTYFILPYYTEQTAPGGLFEKRLLKWSEVKLLSKNGEIGFHGHSAKSYNKWPAEKTHQRMAQGMNMFKKHIGYKPVSFAYTNMIPGRIDLIKQYCPYIRDYFWRDGKVENYLYPEGEYNFRLPESEVPIELLTFRKKIWVMRPALNSYYFKKRLHYLSLNFEFCILILHKLNDYLITISKQIAKEYKVITFKEIFK